MPKTKEELIQLKNEYESLTSKLKELTEEDLKNVLGGNAVNNDQLLCPRCKEPIGTTLEQVIKSKSLICLNCGLRLNID